MKRKQHREKRKAPTVAINSRPLQFHSVLTSTGTYIYQSVAFVWKPVSLSFKHHPKVANCTLTTFPSFQSSHFKSSNVFNWWQGSSLFQIMNTHISVRKIKKTYAGRKSLINLTGNRVLISGVFCFLQTGFQQPHTAHSIQQSRLSSHIKKLPVNDLKLLVNPQLNSPAVALVLSSNICRTCSRSHPCQSKEHQSHQIMHFYPLPRPVCLHSFPCSEHPSAKRRPKLTFMSSCNSFCCALVNSSHDWIRCSCPAALTLLCIPW